MANVRETQRTTNANTTAVDGQSNVEVFDNDRATATDVTRDSGTFRQSDTMPADTTRRDIAEPGTNWGAIILGLLVVLALIALLIWLF